MIYLNKNAGGHMNKGFTLLELVVVLVVLASLVAIALPIYSGFIEKGRVAEVIRAMGAFKTAEEADWIMQSTYPTGAPAGLTMTSPRWTYSVTGGSANFTVTATRQGDGGVAYNNKTITFTYTHNGGAVTWSGDHPYKPR